jgi:hypothetical protein
VLGLAPLAEYNVAVLVLTVLGLSV